MAFRRSARIRLLLFTLSQSCGLCGYFFFSSRRRHTRFDCDWSSDVCSSDLVEKELLWPNPVISSATGKPTTVTGDSGVKMSGPYEYVAPGYWMQDALGSNQDRKSVV